MLDPRQLLQMFMSGGDPALGATMASNPQAVAAHLAQQGIAPPDLSSEGGGGGGWGAPAASFQGPTAADMDMNYDPLAAGSPPPQAAPMPQPRPNPGISFGGAGAPREGTPDAMRYAPEGGAPQAGGDLLKALQDVKAPATPQAQRVSTPAAPRPNALPANNNLIQLLVNAMQANDMNKPLHLADSLGIPRTVRR